MQTVTTLRTYDLKSGDVIHFGDDLCFVVGVECDNPYLDGEIATVVTEGFGGAQYVDYINPMRQFTVVRTV